MKNGSGVVKGIEEYKAGRPFQMFSIELKKEIMFLHLQFVVIFWN